MTSRQITGGFAAVALTLAFLAAVVLTNGWAFFVAAMIALLAIVFIVGAGIAGE